MNKLTIVNENNDISVKITGALSSNEIGYVFKTLAEFAVQITDVIPMSTLNTEVDLEFEVSRIYTDCGQEKKYIAFKKAQLSEREVNLLQQAIGVPDGQLNFSLNASNRKLHS